MFQQFFFQFFTANEIIWFDLLQLWLNVRFAAFNQYYFIINGVALNEIGTSVFINKRLFNLITFLRKT